MDIQAVGVALAGVITAAGAALGGMYTGKSGRRKDENEARINLENFRLQRSAAEETATRGRIEALAADATDARKRLREAEADFDKRMREIEAEFSSEMRESRGYAQRGWDLARYHFGLLASVVHLLNNVLTVEAMGGSPDALLLTVQNAKRRMESLGHIPISLEDPFDNVLKPRTPSDRN